MYEIKAEATITGDLSTIWDIVIDVGNWPAWDPHEQAARLDGGRVLCSKVFRVTGPLVPLFQLYFGRRIRGDMYRTFAALEAEAARAVA